VKTKILETEQGNVHASSYIVRKSGLVVFPTDTVYGIGCDPFNERALKKIYEVKERPQEKGIPVLVSSIDKAHELAHIHPACEELLKRHWPGALTVVVRQKAKFPTVISPDETIALRMPNHPTALALIEEAGGAIATTSANISGEPPATTCEQAKKIFGSKIDAFIDGGVTPGGTASTVVDCTSDTIKVLREGPIQI
jgi:L-threonylcarbamoyladenylate synthase